MKLESKFSIGDKVWVIGGDYRSGHFPFLGTVGTVSVEVVDSTGLPGEDLFHNYMAQKGYKEEYMLVETGIGSGYCYKLDDKEQRIFATKEECAEYIEKQEADNQQLGE